MTYGDACRPESVQAVEEIIRDLGSDRICRNSPAEHDAIIAYTSDLMHIAAAALCGFYAPGMTSAHTAGAFRDCTRIADIDAGLWTELLMMNAKYVLPALGEYINGLTELKTALERNSEAAVHCFLQNAGNNKRRMKELKGVERL